MGAIRDGIDSWICNSRRRNCPFTKNLTTLEQIIGSGPDLVDCTNTRFQVLTLYHFVELTELYKLTKFDEIVDREVAKILTGNFEKNETSSDYESYARNGLRYRQKLF